MFVFWPTTWGEGWWQDLRPHTVLTVISRSTWRSGGPEATHAPPETPLGSRHWCGHVPRTTKPEPNLQLSPRAHLPPASQPAARASTEAQSLGPPGRPSGPAGAKHRPRAPSHRPRTRRARPGRCLRGRSGPAGRGLQAEPAGTRAGPRSRSRPIPGALRVGLGRPRRRSPPQVPRPLSRPPAPSPSSGHIR